MSNGDKVQEGVHFRPGDAPPDHFRLLVINVSAGAAAPDAAVALTGLWQMLKDLQAGRWNEVAGQDASGNQVLVPKGNLSLLIGYGPRLFNGTYHKPRLTEFDRPPNLSGEIRADGTPFAKLKWAPGVNFRAAQGDIALQFLGSTELAVDRAILEVAEAIRIKALPLEISALFRGFHRDDRRSWIGFHDGVNNMASDIRHQAVEALPDGDAPWMDGGTYMAFLRITVDLAQWRALPRTSQEAIVGRDKLTGAPLESVLQRADGSLEVMLTAGCPFNGGLGPAGADPQDCIDPLAAGGEPIVAASHIHRSNLRRQNDPGQDAGNRIFRQGYEFLELNAGKRIEAGLNFVGFTRRMQAVTDILSLPAWLGGANFGGREGNAAVPSIPLMAMLAGGFYAVPPRGEPFPGARLFEQHVAGAAFPATAAKRRKRRVTARA